MWCKEEKSGNPFSESHFSPGQTAEIHNPAEHQNNYTRQEQPEPLHSHTIGRSLYLRQDYHCGKSACHSEANPKLVASPTSSRRLQKYIAIRTETTSSAAPNSPATYLVLLWSTVSGSKNSWMNVLCAACNTTPGPQTAGR
jgi:hypothetical protein